MRIHLIGICGTAMATTAALLAHRGHQVTGSDQNVYPPMSDFLAAEGIPILSPFSADHIRPDVDLVVVGNAISRGNVELEAVLDGKIRYCSLPEVVRDQFLWGVRSIVIAGTHGKTTTTSLIAQVLDTAGLDPTVVNGGIINAWGSNARHGSGDWMVAEADESDGTMVKLPATIAVITNIDPEHLDHYGTFEALREAFVAFAANIPFYGVAALCVDHPEVQGILPRLLDRRVVTYGFSPQADVRGLDVRANGEGVRFTAVITDRKSGAGRTAPDLFLPMFGQHNVQNALAALAVAGAVGIDDEVVRRAFNAFGGVNRRFTRAGEVDGIVVIDDYAHHPVEIAAVLAAARTVTRGQVIAVVQPHRYSRLRNLFEGFCSCFNDADTVIVADIYPAGEEPIEGVDRDALVDGLRTHGHRHVVPLTDRAELARTIAAVAHAGDYVVCLGAGNITQWAQALPGELFALRDGRGRAGVAA
jgi:UDP-N-acetylmuramate--alanine ligase